MHVIGTAGHIDHGKSTLVMALTGTDPDRLQEEQERGMTIDLGFTFLNLPSGKEVGIVDVPGHHRFIRNMLAGVGGVDLALFIVAATESWMPQSQEHLEILQLLGIPRGIIALTKVDQAEEEWIEMVEEEVREKVEGTVLEHAPIIRTAAPKGEGLSELLSAIDEALAETPEPIDMGRPRLWIDRVFTVKGAGTVVTGTLQGGSIKLEDELELVPLGDKARVRGIQSHNRQVDQAPVGGRVALNLAGVETAEIHRGDALVAPGLISGSLRFNAIIEAVDGLERAVPQTSEMKLYIGTAERIAFVKLLDKEELEPGETALAQIAVDRPCAAQWQDRFVLRDPAHQTTIAGGKILMVSARRVRGRDHRYSRWEQSEAHRVLVGSHTPEKLDLDLLRRRDEADIAELFEILLLENGWLELKNLSHYGPAFDHEWSEAVDAAAEKGSAVMLPSFAVSKQAWDRLRERVEEEVGRYHQEAPLRMGLPRETLRSLLGVDWRLFDELIDGFSNEDLVVQEGARLRLPDHVVEFTDEQKEQVNQILSRFEDDPYSPPSLDELVKEGFDEELIAVLSEQGHLVRIGKGLAYRPEVFEEIQARVVDYIRQEGSIDVGVLRDLLGTTRKYALPILEYLDQIEVTRRVGDGRVLGLKASTVQSSVDSS